MRNPSFLDYHLVTSLDCPEMIPIIVECHEPEGPYGAKGLGEPGLAPTPAAIGNAVADAIGSAHLRSAAQAGKRFLGAAEK